MTVISFVHLHVHSEFSLLDGACKIENLISETKKMGQSAIAITDHGVMYAVVDFYKCAVQQGIKPIIGCEVYVSPITNANFDDNKELFHLTLLCENNVGYQNLLRLVSKPHLDCFRLNSQAGMGLHTKTQIDTELLQLHHEGLIALSGCMNGEICRLLLHNDYQKAVEKAIQYQQIFGKDNYFIEIQDHSLPEQKLILPKLIRLSNETQIPLVATNDVHYVNADDAKTQYILNAIQAESASGDKKLNPLKTREFYLKSEKQMLELFHFFPDAVRITAKIAERCNVTMEFEKLRLPRYRSAQNIPNKQLLRKLSFDGLTEFYGSNPDKYIKDRLEYEISIIEKMGFADYFLIVADFVNYAKNNNIPVGPGRGSGAGSLCAYCMKITEIDPIKYNLIFERFLNPERVSMPDFDIDFCNERRTEIRDYIIKKYGKEHVAEIITFGTLGARSAVRDVGNVLGFSTGKINEILKLIPRGSQGSQISLNQAIADSHALSSLYKNDPKIFELIETAKRIEGKPRNASTHPAGVLITEEEINTLVPLQVNNDTVVSQYPMKSLEQLGLLKMDLLRLRNLTIIHRTQELIRKFHPEFSIRNIPLDDKSAYRLIATRNTTGIFQLEADWVREIHKNLKPESIEELAAIISLCRPGPVDSIPQYIQNKQNPAKIRYKHPKLEPILNTTYGCIIYQEQVMEIFRTLAGCSYGHADIIRRAMSKKDSAVMQAEYQHFVSGCRQNNIPENTAKFIFKDMESFASYAFNKSHACAYALISYQTAYLKANYPTEFMTSLLASFRSTTKELAYYINECYRMGITFIPPDINSSDEKFLPATHTENAGSNPQNSILFPLTAIKSVGENLVHKIINERRLNGNYTSLYDFCRRNQGRELNKNSIDSLIKAGCFDKIEPNRKMLAENAPLILDYIRKGEDDQISFFQLFQPEGTSDKDGGYIMKNSTPYSPEERIKHEHETIGICLSAHPLDKFEDTAKKYSCTDIHTLSRSTEYSCGTQVRIIGVVKKIKIVRTKKNDAQMAFLKLEDKFGQCEVTVFPEQFETFGQYLTKNEYLLITGTLSKKKSDASNNYPDGSRTFDEETHSLKSQKEASANSNAEIVAEFIIPTEKLSNPQELQFQKGLYLHLDSDSSKKYRKVCSALRLFHGKTPVFIQFDNLNKLILQKEELFVKLDSAVLGTLTDILGKNNILIK